MAPRNNAEINAEKRRTDFLLSKTKKIDPHCRCRLRVSVLITQGGSSCDSEGRGENRGLGDNREPVAP